MSQQSLHPRQPLNTEEQTVYAHIFKSLDPENLGIVRGETARSTFEKSGLPPAVLGEIWQLVDPNNLGFLNQIAFSIALRLIGHAQTGSTPNKSLIDIVGPIARFQGAQGVQPAPSPTISYTPANSATSQQPLGLQYSSLPPLTNSDISKFAQLFSKNAPTGTVSGVQARSIFLKAKLPTPVLSQIWNLVDRNNSGELNRDEFIAAMFLIQGSLSGSIVQLPPQVPQQIWNQLANSTQSPTLSSNQTLSQPTTGSRPIVSRVSSSFANAANDWHISSQKRIQFDNIFEGLDKDYQGVLSANEVAPFLMTSKLPQDVLASIWDLADIHNTGEFTKDEFAIAMFLIQKKIAGAELPHVIPDSLYPSQHGKGSDSRVSPQQTIPKSQEKSIPQIPSRDTKPKSSLNDLVDLNDAFSTSSPSIPEQANVSNTTVNYTLTDAKAFVPASTFGQEIAENQPSVPAPVSTPEVKQELTSKASILSNAAPLDKAITGTTGAITGAIGELSHLNPLSIESSQQNPFPQTKQRSFNTQNNDLLADSNFQVSGQLSKATTDLANLSNQISSMSFQTSQLNEKRTRAEKELVKVTTLKNEIESKLAKLRVAYEQEVKQTQEVEGLLASSRAATEELRKEASVAEAQHNQVQTQLQAMQTELEENQKENVVLKERLGILNAEKTEATNQLEKTQTEVKKSKGLKAINFKQLSVAQASSQDIKDEAAALLASVKELDSHHETYLQKQANLKALQSEIEFSEQSLTQRQQQLEEAKAAFQIKEQEFQQRLEQQNQRELAIQNEEKSVQTAFESLQERKRQLVEAEQQLDDQTVAYAQRVQDFTYKQIEDVSNDNTAPSVEISAASVSKELEPTVAQKATKDLKAGEKEDSDKDLISAAVGTTAIAATQAPESELNNTEFSFATESTEPSTSVTLEDYQYRATTQFTHLDIERPGSITSSVQSNAPQSDRGDYIEDVPSVDTVTEQAAFALNLLKKNCNLSASRTSIIESETSGDDSFEVVDEHNKSETEYTARLQSNVPELPKEEVYTGVTANMINVSIPGAFSPLNEPKENIEEPDAEKESSGDIVQIRETSEKSFDSASKAVTANVADSSDGTSAVASSTATIKTFSLSPPPVPLPRKVSKDEFPPIQELDIQESDSDNEDEFHETSDQYPSLEKKAFTSPLGSIAGATGAATSVALGEVDALGTTKPATDEFDDFAGMKEAQSSAEEDSDDFDGLQAAEESMNELDDEFTQQPDFNQELEGSTFFNVDTQQPQQQKTGEAQDNEEWEQIFAGFGNQTSEHPQKAGQGISTDPQSVSTSASQFRFNSKNLQTTTSGKGSSNSEHSRIATTPRSLAVQELEGMGFSKEESLIALEREKWNLEAATNYLLDNA